MSYQSIKELPKLIQDRLYLEDYERLFDRIFAAGLVPQEKRKDFLRLIDSILLQQRPVYDLPQLLASTLNIDTEQAQNTANILWSYYFRCFQDFLGSLNDRMPPDSQKESESLIRTLFESHRQLQDVIAPLLYDVDLSECTPECRDALIDILLALAQKTFSENEIKVKLADTLVKYNYKEHSAEDIFTAFLAFTHETFTSETADYYTSLPDLILGAKIHPLLRRQIDEEEMKREIKNENTVVVKENTINQRVETLPSEILDAIRSPRSLELQMALSQRYGVELQDILYRIALKDVSFDHIVFELRKQRDIKPELVAQIRDEIIKTFFEPVMWYFTGVPQPDGEQKKEQGAKAQEESTIQQQGEQKKEEVAQPQKQTEKKAESFFVESYEALANQVIQKCITSLNEDCASRVRRALITRIRNIRTNIETREKLISEMSQGGCGITSEQADCLTREAAGLAGDIQKGLLIVSSSVHLPQLQEQLVSPPSMPLPSPKPSVEPTKLPEPPKPVEQPQPKSKPEAKAPDHLPLIEELPKQSTPKPPTPSPASPPPVQQQPPKAPTNLAIEEVDGIPTFVEKASMPAKPMPPPPPARPTSMAPLKQESTTLKVEVRTSPPQTTEQKKLNVSDVKKAPHLVGPIEELQTFTMKDFRRISANPVQAASRIFDKIQSLEKESLPRKMEAIDAWKRSEVNQLYIEIGKESFGKGVPIAQAIEQRKAAGKEYLSEAEFDALLDLNTMLRA